MNIKNFVLAAASVFLIIEITDFVFHNIILAETYMALSHIWRKDMMDKIWITFIVAIVFSVLFVYIYIRGFSANASIASGIKYGIVMSFLQPFVASLSQYVYYPVPFDLALQWFVYGLIQFVFCGIAVAVIYNQNSRQRTESLS